MPIHIIWGNDINACNKAIEKIINTNVSPNWSSLNISKFNGEDPNQIFQALEEIQSPPLGDGSRIVLLKIILFLILKTKNIYIYLRII